MGLIIASNFLTPVNIVYHKDSLKRKGILNKIFLRNFCFQYDLFGIPGITYQGKYFPSNSEERLEVLRRQKYQGGEKNLLSVLWIISWLPIST